MNDKPRFKQLPFSKRAYCELILQNYCENEGLNREEINESDIYNSSAVAVAMEYLGLIETDLGKGYAASRDGSEKSWIDQSNPEDIKYYQFSTRELLALLPEEKL